LRPARFRNGQWWRTSLRKPDAFIAPSLLETSDRLGGAHFADVLPGAIGDGYTDAAAAPQ
jgi:hypothetical protein